MKSLRPVAIYLPQFHPIPENDAWWGKGFTEWTNVTKAKPLFNGHYQPHLPADLGFYDLRNPELRRQQAQLAKEHGIYGFCYYHYWFNGRRLLDRPFKEVFEIGEPDFPFMLCWANENWTRAWAGEPNQVLMQQEYSPEDDLAHIQSLIPYFKDKRYIRINGRPVFAVYNSVAFPDMRRTTETWRAEARRHGLELYLCRFESFAHFGRHLVEAGGFDAAIDFQPFGHIMHGYKQRVLQQMRSGVWNRLRHRWKKSVISRIAPERYHMYWHESRRRIDYRAYVDFAIEQPFPDYPWFPGITPMWDNTARRGKESTILMNANPEVYGRWLQSIIQKFTPRSSEENLVFINAWNEWGEGCHLEPCQRWGRSYLDVTKERLQA